MAGIDLLIKMGIADPGRMGIFGHSYGGGLASYISTQTNRFRALVNHDGGPNNLLDGFVIGIAPQGGDDLVYINMAGIQDPLSPEERIRRLDQSPALNSNRIKTPTLLYVNAITGRQNSLPIYNLLRRVDVPAVMLVRDMVHGPNWGLQTQDTIAGSIEWLDFWVRGVPYPNPERAAQFESWRHNKNVRTEHWSNPVLH
jgi:hypothetical protein